MIDSDGYRPNVGIILCNDQRQLLWAKRVGQDAWQFPQGGIQQDETPEQALYRELAEEVGLTRAQVDLKGRTQDWLHYSLPKKYQRHNCQPHCRGQKQIWYLLQLKCADDQVVLDGSPEPEFEAWRWIPLWEPIDQVIFFKKDVYRAALNELAPLIEGSEASE